MAFSSDITPNNRSNYSVPQALFSQRMVTGSIHFVLGATIIDGGEETWVPLGGSPKGIKKKFQQ